jgi:hypothetical protein
MSSTQRFCIRCAFVLLATSAWVGLLPSQPPAEPKTPGTTAPGKAVPGKISAFAPADDLLGQVDYYLGRVDTALADGTEFDLAAQSRALKDANTLVVLGQMLAFHDQPHAPKDSMPALVAAAQALSAAEADAAKAKAALAALHAAREGKSPGGMLRWEKAASLPLLMKQVPLVHQALKRGTDGNRLKRQAATAAGQAATLAAIAQASLLDDQYAATPEEAAQWAEFCTQMRDAAGEVNSAAHALDQAGVAAGMKRLLESCDACHARFRRQ